MSSPQPSPRMQPEQPPSDARYNQPTLDARLNQSASDPRLNEPPFDARLERPFTEPRVDQPLSERNNRFYASSEKSRHQSGYPETGYPPDVDLSLRRSSHPSSGFEDRNQQQPFGFPHDVQNVSISSSEFDRKKFCLRLSFTNYKLGY